LSCTEPALELVATATSDVLTNTAAMIPTKKPRRRAPRRPESSRINLKKDHRLDNDTSSHVKCCGSQSIARRAAWPAEVVREYHTAVAIAAGAKPGHDARAVLRTDTQVARGDRAAIARLQRVRGSTLPNCTADVS
jgi:hypothetical protein